MDTKRLSEPSFIASALSCVLLVAVLATRPHDRSASSIPTRPNQNTDAEIQDKEFGESVSMAKSGIDSGDYTTAYDMILVASRLAPSDPRVFDLVVQFIEKAKSSSSDDVIELAEDLLDRGDSLVHFQSPRAVALSRQRLTSLRQSFSTPKSPRIPESPLDSVRKFLAVAENAKVSVAVRSRAAEQARTSLNEAQLDQALEGSQETNQISPSEVQKLLERSDAAEKACIGELFGRTKSKISEWQTATASLAKEIETATSTSAPDVSKHITLQLAQGFDLLQELMPYSKSELEGAAELSAAVEKQIKLLQRQKNWLYNQQTLRLIREVESKKEWSAEDKIRHLAEVSEELLAPYVLRRHNELWDKVFESLPNEDKKVWAVKLRILRINE